MCRISCNRILIFLLVVVSSAFILGLCVGLVFWIIKNPQSAPIAGVVLACLAILYILSIIVGSIRIFAWNDYLDFEKIVFIIAYAALALSCVASLCYLSHNPDAIWLSGFFLSICVGLITGLVIYFLTNKRRQDERYIEDEIKILQETKDSYKNVCLFLYFELMNRDSDVEYENPFEKFPTLVNRFMTDIRTLSKSTLIQIKKTQDPMICEDPENQAVLNIITNFPNRTDYYIETYAKTKNSEEVKKLRDEFIKELIILEIFVDTKLDEAQKASYRIKYSMF